MYRAMAILSGKSKVLPSVEGLVIRKEENDLRAKAHRRVSANSAKLLECKLDWQAHI
jgi:hypothetical protein